MFRLELWSTHLFSLPLVLSNWCGLSLGEARRRSEIGQTFSKRVRAIVPASDRVVNQRNSEISRKSLNWPSDVGTRQRLRAIVFSLACLTLLSSPNVEAQIRDSLDAYPPRFHLDDSDCDARVIGQEHLADGGVDHGACETITFVANHGTEAILVYPIEPVRPVDELTANVSLMSARPGAEIGFRIRYPYLHDRETRRTASVIVYGASYSTPGEFSSVGVGMIERPLKLKEMALRGEHGRDVDLNDAYVDAIIINAYTGAGSTTLRMDQMIVDGLIPVGDGVATGNRREEDESQNTRSMRVDSERPDALRSLAFPVDRITRVLEHNGEPLAWVRSLGFDAVLLSHPPDAAILSEAIRARMSIYAPAPTPDPSLESLLEPIAGWYLGSGEALDSRQIDSTGVESANVRALPSRWQRPLLAAPSEAWRSYAPLFDALIDDLPPRVRGVRGDEEVVQMIRTHRQVGDRVQKAVGIASMPPRSMLDQAEAIATAIGASPPESFRWHSMLLQTMRSLESTPSAILFRSTRSLSSGSMLENHRSMALSYINRMVAMIAPWVVSATPVPPPRLTGAPYRCTRLNQESTDVLILTSLATRGAEVLAGDGDSLEIALTPTDASKTCWRLTHFSAERLIPETTPTGAKLEIVSPDVTEIVVLSSDPAVGGKLSLSAQRYARQASLDRWQLASDSVRRTRQGWNQANAARAADRAATSNMIEVAEQTLRDAEPAYRAGDVNASLRMAHRADAWTLRSQWQLAEALMPDWPMPTSSPPMDFGAAEIQTTWRPLMDDAGWGPNLMTSGSLDEARLIGAHQWTFGRRMSSRALSEISHVTRGTFQGAGALRARVTPLADDRLPGGYEGTIVQIRSPSVRIPAGSAIRIDAMVRTIGFGDPHQGVLVYDTIGGQEMGVLVRGRADYTPVRLYRQSLDGGEVQVMFELLGAGEATIDDVRLSLWDPQVKPKPMLRPLDGDSASR